MLKLLWRFSIQRALDTLYVREQLWSFLLSRCQIRHSLPHHKSESTCYFVRTYVLGQLWSLQLCHNRYSLHHRIAFNGCARSNTTSIMYRIPQTHVREYFALTRAVVVVAALCLAVMPGTVCPTVLWLRVGTRSGTILCSPATCN